MAEEGQQEVAGIDRRWWYVIGAGAGIAAYFIYRYYKNRQSGVVTTMPSGAGTATTDLSGTNGTTGSVASVISTLSDWMSQAQTWLVKSLNADPALVQGALQHYANGHCLTAAEYNLIDKALGQLGMPPSAPYQGLIKCATPPAPKPPPAKTPILPANELSKFTRVTNSTVLNNLLGQGYQVFNMGNIFYYLPGARVRTGKGHVLQWVGGPTQQSELRAAGYTIYVYNNRAFYDPTQRVVARV